MLDEDGTTRMSLNDGSQMDMYDLSGNPRLSLGTQNISDDRPDSPLLEMYDGGGTARCGASGDGSMALPTRTATAAQFARASTRPPATGRPS